MLSYFSGIRYSELATRFRVPYATIRNWQQRSLERLHSDLSGGSASKDVILAGEYVLDVIPVPEHEEFEKRLMKDQDLQIAVAGWTEDFIVLTDRLPNRVPQPDLLTRLDLVLFPEQMKPLWRRVRLFQSVFWVAIAGGVAWAGYTYWPELESAVRSSQSEAPQQTVAQISGPDEITQLPATGDLTALFDGATGMIQIGGDPSTIANAANLHVYLDFGENTEWIGLGSWPTLAPRVMEVPVEIRPIIKGAEIVILGGEGSDQEMLRLTVE